jgi:hypothetical protein
MSLWVCELIVDLMYYWTHPKRLSTQCSEHERFAEQSVQEVLWSSGGYVCTCYFHRNPWRKKTHCASLSSSTAGPPTIYVVMKNRKKIQQLDLRTKVSRKQQTITSVFCMWRSSTWEAESEQSRRRSPWRVRESRLFEKNLIVVVQQGFQ